jgi:hypothetical protein
LKGAVVVHDHFKPYHGLLEVYHAFCNARILRELKALIELEKEPWAELMRAVLRKANTAVRAAREAGKKALAPEEVKGVRRELLGGGADGSGLASRAAEVADDGQGPWTSQTVRRPQSARQVEKVHHGLMRRSDGAPGPVERRRLTIRQ